MKSHRVRKALTAVIRHRVTFNIEATSRPKPNRIEKLDRHARQPKDLRPRLVKRDE